MLPDKIYIANNLKRDGENIFYFGQTTRKVETAIRELNEDKANSGRFELVKAYWVKMDKGVKEVVLKKFQNKNIFKDAYERPEK